MRTEQLIFAGGGARIRLFQISICAMALLYFTGCASGNYRQADAASSSLRTASVKIEAENRAIDMTLSALDDLIHKPAPDLKPQFKSFSSSLDRLVDSSRRVEKAADVADQKSGDYFQSWDKETYGIKYEAIRDRSVSRKTQVSNEFNTVNQRYRQNQAVIEPLIAYLQDIRIALGTDLTAEGVQSVKSLAENAKQNARKVQAALARLSDDLSASAARMSSVTPPETVARGGTGDATETTQHHDQSSP